MEKNDYWELFWISGLPEAWMMSRPERGDLNSADMTAKALPHRRSGLPEEARTLSEKQREQGEAEMGGPTLTGQ